MGFSGTKPAAFIRENALVEAIQWRGTNYGELYKWVMGWDLIDPGISNFTDYLEVTTHYGSAILKEGDWLVRDILNETFYRASAVAFEGVYKPTP
jgi:hypothetical protein